MLAVVVGGGAAGLSAALAVRQAGWACAVLETRRRGQASSRDVHVHRLSSKGAEALAALAPSIPTPSVVTLDELERDLLQAAEAADADVRFGATVVGIVAQGGQWIVRDANDGLHLADLLIDASGGRRAGLSLLEAVLPDIVMDDLGGAESFISWSGRSGGEAQGLTRWDDPESGLDGLIQVGPKNRASLTCRHPAGCSPPPLDGVIAAIEGGLGPEAADRARGLGFQGRGVRYTTAGVQRIALDEADLMGLPPFALVGDALILEPPRFGEGLQRAFEQALMVTHALVAGEAATLGARLAEDARRAWAGNGLALACRSLT